MKTWPSLGRTWSYCPLPRVCVPGLIQKTAPGRLLCATVPRFWDRTTLACAGGWAGPRSPREPQIAAGGLANDGARLVWAARTARVEDGESSGAPGWWVLRASAAVTPA